MAKPRARPRSGAGRRDPVQQAVAELRASDGTAVEVAALARRLARELSAPTHASDKHRSAPRTLVRVIARRSAHAVLWIGLGLSVVYTLWRMQPAPQPEPVTSAVSPALAGPVEPAQPPAEAPADAAPPVAASRRAAAAKPTAAPRRQVSGPGAPAKAAGAGGSRARTRGPARSPTEPSPEGELQLLTEAQQALGTLPGVALELARQHASSYPQGVFVEEREVIALEAELKLRHKADAVARAERFLQRFPRSAHARRVRLLVPEVLSSDSRHGEDDRAPVRE